MIAMEKKEKKMGRPRVRSGATSGNRSGSQIMARIDPDIKNSLVRYVELFNSKYPRTTEGAVIEKALKEFLDRNLVDLEKKE
jgi:hypothetical protein